MGDAKRVAIVDDEQALGRSLSFALRKEGFMVDLYHDGASAWEVFCHQLPDLIILDIMMPRMDGLQLCRRIRNTGSTVPLIFLSSRDEEVDKLLGFELGGDDYLTKPFSVRELIARVKAVARRNGSSTDSEAPVTAGHWFLDCSSARCCFKEQSIALTVTEMRILSALMRMPGVVKTREQLMNAAFPEDRYPNERAADSHIKRLRKKLALAENGKDPIETIYGMGYRFVVPDL
jgi:DNA-binding response OmpR family regulator